MQKRKRVRATLLVLLWIWAACVFTTLDIFLNVPEFDGIRPDVRWYRAARYAGHRMVGEPYRETDAFGEIGEERVVPEALSAPASRLRVANGAAPDAETAALIADRLRAFAQRTRDPAVRAAAGRAIARLTETGD